MKKINLEHAFYDAINNPSSPYGVDDLNILLGNFKGNFKTLKKLSGLEFTQFENVLESRSLP